MIFVALVLCLQPAVLPPPPLRDLERFPPFEVAQSNAHFACNHVGWLEKQTRLGGWQGELYFTWMREANRRRFLWVTLENAADPSFSGEYRRETLGELRKMLGEADYFAGRMPPPVPLEYFSRH